MAAKRSTGAKRAQAIENETIVDNSIFDETLGDIDEGVLDQVVNSDVVEDEMMDRKVGATITDGEYKAKLVDIRPIATHYTTEETVVEAGVKTVNKVEKTGKVYNFIWVLADGRQLIDPRFTRDSDDDARKYQSINIALGNIATQLGKTTLTMRELLTEKPTLTVWVSRVGRNRNVDYLKPVAKQQAVGSVADVANNKAPF